MSGTGNFACTALLLLVAGNCFAKVDNIENYLKVCDRTSPDVNDCLVEAIADGLPKMCDGIADLGVPPVDPYHQKELKVQYKNNQIAVIMIMRDIYVSGLRQAEVKDVRLKADEDSLFMEIDMTTPEVFVNGTYHGEGGWNSLHINTTGTFNTTMKDLVYTWKLGGKTEKIDGETYLRINSFYMRPDLSDLKSYLTNDDPATREFTNLGQQFANANWKSLYRELLPYAQDNWNRIGIRVANKVCLKVPYDQLFPAKS
ncbi:hypothetical protein O0L34_g9613 [Tuta absoluta]|nr:hypothetical protein O0L34_g9613 [Tuta absoluta]